MKGKLIVIESGTDASGKATQTEKLYNRLNRKGYNVHRVEYPNYKSKSSALIKMYLRGEFGEKAEDVNAYAASTFYAVDRFASYRTDWWEKYDNGGIIIADRYTTSNMVHQAGKITDQQEKGDYLGWLRDLEFNKFRLPIPDVVILLDMPPEMSIKLMEERNKKFTGKQARDIHEKDKKHLIDSYENACWLAKKYDWKVVPCVENGGLKTIEEIHEEIYKIVRQYLK